MSRLAFLGLGNMGRGMADCLLRAGHEVRVFNRTAARGDALIAAGAIRTSTPREACEGADAIFAMTADDDSSRAMWLGTSGALAARAAPGALAIECSTLSYEWVMALSQHAQAQGLRYVDSPVTGLPSAAASGRLTLLVGAAPQDLAAARQWLDTLADRVLHFGAIGTGTIYKLVVNMIGAIQIASAAEGMALAERAGLDLKVVADAIALGQAASPQVVRNTRRIADDDHAEVIFTPRLRLKDVDYALRLAKQLEIATPFGQAAAHAFRRLIEMGSGAMNESRVIDVARGKRR